jgi:hypothetical protein
MPIYTAQGKNRAPIMLDNEMFMQVEAEVLKNAKRDDYVKGLLSEYKISYQLTYEGGAGVCLHFPGCPKSFELELKFAVVLCEPTQFQVWGTRKLGREFHKKLVGHQQSSQSTVQCGTYRYQS